MRPQLPAKPSPQTLPSDRGKMLHTGRYFWLMGIWLVGVRATHSSDFVTVRRQQNRALFYDSPEQSVSEQKMSRNQVEVRAYFDFGERYRLRFKPLHPMPRLFWHKFPQPQAEEPQPQPTQTPTPTAPPIDYPDEPETEEPTELPTAEPTAAPTTPAVTTTTSTTQRTVIATSSRAPPRPASTANAVMRPPDRLRPLKNLLLFGSPVEANLIQQRPGASKTKSKGFLSVFEVIKFANSKCSVFMGDIRSMEGVCYHEFECKSLGGISTERCAEGVGVCCIFLTGCGDVTKQPVVYFESPNYPNPVHEMMICLLIINVRDNVQQLRLDFLMFELNRPTNGDCLDDQFIVSGQNINFVVPTLCGINTGQHIYIDVDNSFEKKIYLSFLSKIAVGGRSFNIKVTQLESDLAPDGCLQYFTETEGLIKSFNYDMEGSIVDNREATYLNNLNYAICFQRAKDSCSMTYTVEQLGGDQPDFQIVNKDEEENDLVPVGQAGAGIFNCPDDYIAVNQVRLCGERFNDGIESEDFTMHAPVKDVAAGPIILPVRTDVEYVGRGFRLIYKQELCV